MQIKNIYFLILYVLVYSYCIILNIFLSVYFYFFPHAIERGFFDWDPDCNIFNMCDWLSKILLRVNDAVVSFHIDGIFF